MIWNTFKVSVRSAILPVLFVSATTALLATRIANAGPNPIEWLRAGIGAVSLVALIAMKRFGFMRATAYAFAVECVGGAILFAFVDAPAVQAHIPDIVRAVATVAPHGLR